MNRPRFVVARAATRLVLSLGLVFALAAPVADARAQAVAPPTALSPNPADARADREFLDRSLQDGLGEVALAALAPARSGNPAIQALAAGLAQEQGPLNEEAARLAQARGSAALAGLDRSHQDEVERLSKLAGADFDRAYLKQMVDGHRLAITDFERQATQTQDLQVKDFCVRVLPVLRGHLRLSSAQQEATKVAP